ncbi:MAG: hypothetical protein KKE02_21195 [Alphaproteobacteria bacterium]|nr:hypothetical protein [Alphaproteobacteria bacterium]MBU1516204.1 hypothetical protein [Alphaproteobacteria bacterium]MBU2093514.1 hypothetical protein [Alphaproteobacteria bacterium]MBU2153548.1 hypothetical protein [Alphaproteobacteria bacterium]MBU2308176.1 hypothetical protein [Alphaproteobacteria bacterium]
MPKSPRPKAVRTLARQPAPVGIYAPSYDAALAAGLCRRLAAGESLRSMCRADPAMPTEKTVWNWARARPDFAAAKAMAMAISRAADRARHAERRAAKLERWEARAATSRDGRARIPPRSTYTPEIGAAICHRLCLGEALYRVCRDPAMPSQGTVYNWLRADPVFRAMYQRAKAVAFVHVVDTAAARARWLGTEAASMRGLARLEAQAHARCAKLAPRTFGRGRYGPID